ncbi:MAG: hypothetical protein GX245_01045 [Eubacteriaceae bacterium]|jgi:hypothetical protein|nr:hypothetical protein [Eubacteriaceae bacterium]
MKKSIVFLILIALLGICLTGCGKPKTAITPEQFVSITEAKGFILVDKTEIADGQADAIWVAVSPKKTFQIEFFDLLSEKQAKAAYAENVATFESMKGSASTTSSAEIKNYSIKTVVSNGLYMYECRVDDTIIYVVSDSAYKGEIEEIIAELGY